MEHWFKVICATKKKANVGERLKSPKGRKRTISKGHFCSSFFDGGTYVRKEQAGQCDLFPLMEIEITFEILASVTFFHSSCGIKARGPSTSHNDWTFMKYSMASFTCPKMLAGISNPFNAICEKNAFQFHNNNMSRRRGPVVKSSLSISHNLTSDQTGRERMGERCK